MALDLAADALVSTVSALSPPPAPAGPGPATPPPAATTPAPAAPTTPNTAALAGSQTLTGLEVRLARVFVKDNHTVRIGPFPGRADLYLLVLVTDGYSLTPSQVTLTNFPGISDNQDLLVDRTVYFWEPGPGRDTAPSQLHVLVSVLKSKQHLRDAGTLLGQLQTNPDYQSLVGRLAGGAVAAAGQAPSLLLQVGTFIGGLLTNVEDKTLLTQVTSFTDLNGDFDKLGATPHAQENQYVATTLTLVVRDAGRN